MLVTPSQDISFLSDHESQTYSISCGACQATTTHKCDHLNEAELHLYAGRFELSRDASDKVFVLSCVTCGPVDISPFMSDIRSSISDHLEFHDFVAAQGRLIEETHVLEVYLIWDDFEATFDDERVDSELQRWCRVQSWSVEASQLPSES